MFTTHSNDRINNRLAGLIDDATLSRIEAATHKYTTNEKIYFVAKKFSQVQHLENGEVNGDAIIAVIRNGHVITTMLGKSWRKDYFARDGRLVF